jgi:hypothetical protein
MKPADRRINRRSSEDSWSRTRLMLVSRETLRRSLIAVLAIWGAVSAFPARADAGMAAGRGCEVSASLTSCCTLRPEACTASCRTSSPIALQATGTTSSHVLGESAEAACNPVRCECRSSEPVAPSSTPESRRGESRSDLGDGLSDAWLLHVLVPAPAAGVVLGESARLKLPLYLLTTHLRF